MKKKNSKMSKNRFRYDLETEKNSRTETQTGSDVTLEKSWKFLVFCSVHRIWGLTAYIYPKPEKPPKGACQRQYPAAFHCARASGAGPSAASSLAQKT